MVLTLDDLFQMFLEFGKKLENNGVDVMISWMMSRDEITDEMKIYFIKTLLPRLESEIKIIEDQIKMKYELTE